jgi:hypothetical protein
MKITTAEVIFNENISNLNERGKSGNANAMS